MKIPQPPVLALIAGPNGSGKTTFYERQIKDGFPVFVNADRIAEETARASSTKGNLEAAERAELERQKLIMARESFATETVFSRTSHWLGFVESARAKGYSVWLYFICVEAPELNMARVVSRVSQGGHPVPLDKVKKRWNGSLNTAVLAIPLADELWLYDNSVSNRDPRLVGHFVQGRVNFQAVDMPLWTRRFFGLGLIH